jgi:hypothetical protein
LANVPDVSWSDELSQHASEGALNLIAAAPKGCTSYNCCRKSEISSENHAASNPKNYPEGENLFYSSGSLTTPPNAAADAAIQSWALKEAPMYWFPPNTQNHNESTGHYAQIIARRTTQIGCAHALGTNSCSVVVCRYYEPLQIGPAV